MLDTLARNWSWFAMRGALAIAFGLTLIAWPGITLTTIVFLFGAYTVGDGVAAMVAAMDGSEPGVPAWAVLGEGASGIAVGVLTFFLPVVTGLLLLYLIATRAIVTGVLELVGAIQLRRQLVTEVLLAVAGGLSIATSVLLVILPTSGVLAEVWVVGGYVIAFGAAMLLLAMRLHAFADQVEQSRMAREAA